MGTLKVGDKAPDIKTKDQNGNDISLSDYRGKKVILYFYPKDNTPGCTAQACNLRDHYEDLKKEGYEVIGVSIDSARKHQNFIKKYDLPFTLITDESKEVVDAFGVFGEKKFMGRTYMGTKRTTFIIDEDGIIQHIIDKPKTKTHTEQIREVLAK